MAMRLQCLLEDVQEVSARYPTEREFRAAADRYLQLIESTGGLGLDEKEVHEALAVLRVASIQRNGSWKSPFTWFDPAEEFHPRKRNRFEVAILKTLGSLQAASVSR
ncbi:MAG: hypothetical protein WCT45_01250 [Candidatus Paceibacterota bacterium]|jgi:hypothetical protein